MPERTEPTVGNTAKRLSVAGRSQTKNPLHDASHPAYPVGAAAEAIGVTPVFLRTLDKAGLFQPHRSMGGHRRYSRIYLEQAARARELVDEGIPVAAAVRIVHLEYRLAAAEAALELLRSRYGESGFPNPVKRHHHSR